MKVAVDFIVDTDTGDYEVVYHNLSKPGGAMDLTKIIAIMKRVIPDHENDTLDDAAYDLSGQAKLDR